MAYGGAAAAQKAAEEHAGEELAALAGGDGTGCADDAWSVVGQLMKQRQRGLVEPGLGFGCLAGDPVEQRSHLWQNGCWVLAGRGN